MPLDACLNKARPPCNTKEIARDLVSHQIADQLSPHHDSQFSAFSTEVLDRASRKYNRSSSPFTTLAKKQNVGWQAQEPRNPTIDQRRDQEPMHIM